MPRIRRITGTEDNDIITVTEPGMFHLEGLAGDDTLIGGADHDSLYGGTGNDDLNGNDGDDYLNGGAGSDTLAGGDGVDTAGYSGSSSGVKVSLATGLGSGGDAEGDTLSGIENLSGSNFVDKLTGDGTANELSGAGGNDSLYGGGGDDRLRGDEGADYLNGGAGIDTADYIRSSTAVSVDLLAGTATGGHAQGDRFKGVENVSGTFHDDTIVGDAADNVLNGMFGNDTLFGGDGADTLEGLSGDDVLFGGEGADTLNGSFDNDTLEGGAGADTIDGSLGVDTASYASSNAGVRVSLQTGVAGGGHAQGDVLTGIENLTGSAFNDMLGGSSGDNVILGGNGNDTIIAGAGTDHLWGGAGDDRFVFNQLDQPVGVGGTNFEWIGDFVAGGSIDEIDLSNAGTGFRRLSDVIAHSTEVAIDAKIGTLIDLGPSGQVYLADVGMADLATSDFIFL